MAREAPNLKPKDSSLATPTQARNKCADPTLTPPNDALIQSPHPTNHLSSIMTLSNFPLNLNGTS